MTADALERIWREENVVVANKEMTLVECVVDFEGDSTGWQSASFVFTDGRHDYIGWVYRTFDHMRCEWVFSSEVVGDVSVPVMIVEAEPVTKINWKTTGKKTTFKGDESQ